MSDRDVVVIGAGLAGLSAASRLAHAGLDVVVLEARDRVGGRLEEGRLPDGSPIELGGQWLGPTQSRMRALVDELGLQLFRTHDVGDHLLVVDGQQRRFSRIPPLGLAGMLDAGQSFLRLGRLVATVEPESPWAAPDAEALDGQTFETWLQRVCPTRAGRLAWRLFTRAVFAAEPAQVSLLHVLFYVAAGGGVRALIETTNGAQQDRVVGGSWEIARRLADRLGAPIELGTAVSGIDQRNEDVVVSSTDAQTWSARSVVVALPLHLAGGLTMHPPLPSARQQALQRVPMGAVIKLHVVFERPWWRARGLSGQVLSDGAGPQVVFDNSVPGSALGVLLAFLEGDEALAWADRGSDARADMLTARLRDLFGGDVPAPIAVVERDWTAERFTGGCYGAVLPPGVWTRFGPQLRQPFERVHFAAAELATTWAGYMEGAVRSGEAAAGAVLRAAPDGVGPRR